MKAFGLVLTTLGFVALAQSTQLDYPLTCASQEMGIRWPNYNDKSEYFVCNRLGGKPMVIDCNPGEYFTFVLQMCTSAGKYIPAPPVSRLPIAASVPADRNHKETGSVGHPPIENSEHEMPIVPPTVDIAAVPEAPVVEAAVDAKPVEEVAVVDTAVVEAEANKENVEAVDVPLPPTPAPTPPVVSVEEEKPVAKKPSADKKKSSSKKTKNEKKKTNDNKSKAGKKSGKKPAKKEDSGKKSKTQSKKKEKTPKA
ncbi:uncharacterized protein [Musca autumnalis]|uniref:uncharacterized protein n=1 Tax=Musca autumnalis TaxID=221902 RepID=UPI003CF6B425